MKKLFNSRFLFILASSLVVLILLTVGAFYLFDDKDDTFVRSGYVLNPLSATSEKYFFDENVGYKENLSSMIEFVDVDDNTVSILKESFVHYLDESISLLKNGAILDLDSVKGNNAVSFYNITNKSLIEKKDDKYVIETINDDIVLNNFISRISDNKYIVVGDLSLKMAGNSTSVTGDYFEIVYIEEGIVNIENKDVKYQVAADNTLIYVGSDKVIDLGDKKIIVDDVDIMSITSITIDGDENIEIIPKAEKEDDEPSGNGGSGGSGIDGTGSGDGDGNGTGGGTGGSGSGLGDGTGDGTGSGDGTGGTGGGTDGENGENSDNIESDETDDVVISLKDVQVGSTNIDVVFDVVNALEEDKFMLQVVNLSTGRTVDMVAEVLTDVSIRVNLLTPNTKYLFMVVNERDNGKYFQKVLETTGFGIKLEKSYATSDSLAYNIIVEEGTDIVDAKLTLYKFNEETMKNEIVTGSYTDAEGKTITYEKIFDLSSLKNFEDPVVFDGLDSNTIYTAVLDEFSVASTNFKDIYNISLSSMTLKKTPGFNEMEVSKNVDETSFDLSLGEIKDPDNAIISYTYLIYDKGDNRSDEADDTLALEPIVQTNASAINVKVGDGENQLKRDRDYYYKVVIEYFDNEKYIEYMTASDNVFKLGNEPLITVSSINDQISFDSIGAEIVLEDTSCMVPMPGRENENCIGNSTTILEIRRVSPLTGIEANPFYTEEINFEVTNNKIKKDIYLDELEPGTTYYISVILSQNGGADRQEIAHKEDSVKTISTKSLASFNVEWPEQGSNEEHVVNVGSKFVEIEGTGSSDIDSAAEIKEVIVSIYEGNVVNEYDRAYPIVQPVSFINSDAFNIKDTFTNGDGYIVSSKDTFGLSMIDLINKNENEVLSEFYTIVVKAYYDLDRKNEVDLKNSVISYQINPNLIAGDVETVLNELVEIKNSDTGKIYKNLINGGTIVGYRLNGSFDRAGLAVTGLIPQKLHFYVYNTITKEKLNFYTMNDDGELILTKDKKYTIDLSEGVGFFENVDIYMDYGTDYETVDDVMRRGNYFTIGYEIESIDGDGNTWLNTTPSSATSEEGYVESPTGYGVYREIFAEKETPTLKMYIAKSSANSITYDYKIQDPDSAIYKETESDTYGFYATVEDGAEFKIDMIPLEGAEFNQFAGRFTIDELSNGDKYSLYYKKNQLKSGNLEKDILNYIEGESSGVRIFDGYYDLAANADKYGFKYQIISNPLKDNRVVIKLAVDESLLSRILSYKVKFEDSNGKVKEIELGDKEFESLSVCPGEVDMAPRCISIDYSSLKDMKSDINKTNTIKVTVTAIYDNGLTGIDFIKSGVDTGTDYLYSILQNNSSESGIGGYVSFNSTGDKPEVWNENSSVKGYYTSQLMDNGNLIYQSQRYPGMCDKTPSLYCFTISTNLSSTGYSSSWGILNPKMVSIDEISCSTNSDGSACNTFSFSSITPMVEVNEKNIIKIINGGVVNLKLSGIDLEDIQSEDGEYYLYIDTWDNVEQAGVVDGSGNLLYPTIRPTVKVKIDKANPTGTISITIDSLKESSDYYFAVYANMFEGLDRSGNPIYVRTQLFDTGITDETGEFETKIYNFKSANGSDVFNTLSTSYVSSDEVYGNRILNTKIGLLGYKGNIPYNFDLVYILCEVGDETCGPDEGDTRIFREEILLEELIEMTKTSTDIEDSVDISEYDLEYGKNYHMWIYANFDYYDIDTDTVIKRNVVINEGKMIFDVFLKKLTEPTFEVTRNAILNNGEYGIDFKIIPNDPDRTLVDGKYFIKLLDSQGNIVGNMQLLDEEDNYYDVINYHEYAFDASVPSTSVRITGLDSNTAYRFVVYNDAYINNYSEEIPKEERIYEVSKSLTVYTTNDYGVAFGTATYGVTENAFVVTFLGGSNFENVIEVGYTIGLWDDENPESSSTTSGLFVIGENDKYFELYKNSEDWIFIINPTGMKNTLGKTYKISINFKVKVPGTEETIFIDKNDVSSFEGTVTYYEE